MTFPFLPFNALCSFLQDNTLSKDEVRVFILRAVKEGIFAEFFLQQEQKEQAAVDALYDEIFLDAFISQDDDLIDKNTYCNVVSQKLNDDEQLRSLLLSQFDLIDKGSIGAINENQVKQCLTMILKRQIQKLKEGDSDESGMKMDRYHFTEGAYAMDTI